MGTKWHPVGVNDGRVHDPCAWRFYAVSKKEVTDQGLRNWVIQWQIDMGLAAVGFVEGPMYREPESWGGYQASRIANDEPYGVKHSYAFAKQMKRGDLILLSEGRDIHWAWGILLDDDPVFFDDDHPVWRSDLPRIRSAVWEFGTYEQYRNARRVDEWRPIPDHRLPPNHDLTKNYRPTVVSLPLMETLSWLGESRQVYDQAIQSLPPELPPGALWIPEPLRSAVAEDLADEGGNEALQVDAVTSSGGRRPGGVVLLLDPEEDPSAMERLSSGQPFNDEWKCWAKSTTVGDTALVVRVGEAPTGLIALGVIVGPRAKHSDGDWLASVRVEHFRKVDDPISYASLATALPEVFLSPLGVGRRSGQVYLSPDQVAAVHELWVEAEGVDEAEAGGRSESDVVEDHTAPKSVGQGRFLNQAAKKAVEVRAMAIASEVYRKLRYAVVDTSCGNPYDLEVKKGSDVRRVEVKGSSSPLLYEVVLTRNEVLHAQGGAPCPVDLVVVMGIRLEEGPDGDYDASGGEARRIPNWRPDDDDLTPTVYRYRLP